MGETCGYMRKHKLLVVSLETGTLWSDKLPRSFVTFPCTNKTSIVKGIPHTHCMRNWYYLFSCIIVCLGEEERWTNVSSHEGGE